ncbi:hypothetical protein CLAFUR4_07501 [Fulvia fulva]|nr:hypothetical protein CLAFUR4_07501 [Fulvia fulva]
MASDRDEVVRDRDCLRLIVDYGSGLLKAAVQHIKAGDTPSQTRMYEVMLKPGQKVVEQKVIQLEKGRILWGRSEVQKYKRENPREAGNVIELWKLLLCPQYRDALTARRLCRAFTGQDSFNEEVMVELEDFIAGHLREVKTATLKWLYYHHPKGLQYDADYWHAVPIEFMITVPAMWGQESQRLMKNASMKAGFSDISLRYEELCAAAAESQPLLESGDVEYGWKVCFVDIGRGTIDISTVQILEEGITMVGDSTGALAGSQVVNEKILEYVIQCDQVQSLGGWKEACRRLDIDRDSFLEQVSTSVESQKAEFPDIENMLIDIRPGPDWRTVTDGDDNAIGQDGMTIRIPYEALETCYRVWFDKISAAIQRHLAPREQDCHTAILTGGGSSNSYIREHCDRLFTKLIGRASRDNTSGKQPVCHGGLTHYPESAVHDLPEGYLYMCQNEEYDPKIHKDCTSRKRSRHGKRKSLPDDSKLIVWAEGSIDETRQAPNRLNLVMSNVEGHITTDIALTHWIVSTREDAVIVLDLYHSVMKLQESGPIKDRNGSVRKELTKWPILFSDLPDLATHGFQTYTDQGKEAYRVSGYVEIAATRAHMELTLVLLKPVVAFKYDKRGIVIKRRGTYTEDEMLCRRTIEVFDGRRSHMIAKDLPETGPAAGEQTVAVSPRARRQTHQRTGSASVSGNAYASYCDDDEPLAPGQIYKLEELGRAGVRAIEREDAGASLSDAVKLRPRQRKAARTGRDSLSS